MKKRIVGIAVLALFAAAGWWGWKNYVAATEGAVVTTTEVVRGSVSETILASGIIEAEQLVSVGARVSGQVETLAVSLGQEVAQGDLIAQIDSQDQENNVLQAEADLAEIKAGIAAKQASLRNAQLILERQEKMVEQKYVSQEDLESSIADVLVYESELEALQAQKSRAEVTVSTAEIALGRTKITAPIDGTVVAIVTKAGQMVNATNEAPTIVKLANLDEMVVKAEISEADVVHVHAGQSVIFSILGEPEKEFEAIVRDIEPAPSEIETSDTISTDEAIYYNGLFDVSNTDHTLRIGMTTEVSIVLNKAENVLTLPASVLKKDPRGNYFVEIYDPDNEQIRPQSVEVGLNDKVTAEIVSGLSEGDHVVTSTTTVPDAAPTEDRGGMGGPPGMGF
jgi:macrolide-specific efflux system membrane fusion protein